MAISHSGPQPGIGQRPQEHLIVAALTFTTPDGDVASARAAAEQLRALVHAELLGELAATNETGELGFAAKHKVSGLSVVLGVSTSGYQRLGATPEQTPVDLAPMPPDVLDSSGSGQGSLLTGEGDLLLKVAGDDPFVVEHVLRRVEVELPALAVLWAQVGTQRYDLRESANPRHESRALIGFLDGTANLHADDPADETLIYTDHTNTSYPPIPTAPYGQPALPSSLRQPPSGPEPAALDGGSYLDLEVMALNLAAFDAAGLDTQQAAVGRTKIAGDPLPGASAASHVQKANPHRSPDDELRRFLRRGWGLIRPDGAALLRGLILFGFGRTLSTQMEFVRRGWINNPDFPTAGAGKDILISTYVQVRLVCGGYYFVPPLALKTNLTSWVLPS